MRTTGLQVSGYSFVLRRTELALVTGDPRMAHDPLRTQRRAVGVGALLALLVAGGMLLVAMMRPAPSVGDAGLVADESGALYVRLGEAFHPVTNVASARLLLGSPETVQKTTAGQLADLPAGPPVGIPDAPGLVPAPDGTAAHWVLCGDGTVVASATVTDAGPQVLVTPSGWWLVVDGRRLAVPEQGATVSRALGAVPVEAEDAVVAVLDRGPDVVLPAGDSGLPGQWAAQGRVVTAGDRAFVVADGGLAEVTGARRAVAEALAGTAPEVSDLGTVLGLPGAEALTQVPADLEFRQVDAVCAGDRLVERPEDADTGGPAGDTGTAGISGATGGSGAGTGTGGRYAGPRGTVALATERGLVLVSGAGVRYAVGSTEDLAALGVLDEGELPVSVPWRVIAPLPDGGELSAERAGRTLGGS